MQQQFTNAFGGFGGQYIGTRQQFADTFRKAISEGHQCYLAAMADRGIGHDALTLDEYTESHLSIHLDPVPENDIQKHREFYANL